MSSYQASARTSLTFAVIFPSTVDPKDVRTLILIVAPLESGDFAVFI